MIAGSVVLSAILFAIGASAMKSFPSFSRHVRMGLRLAAGQNLGSDLSTRRPAARVIPFPVGRVAGR